MRKRRRSSQRSSPSPQKQHPQISAEPSSTSPATTMRAGDARLSSASSALPIFASTPKRRSPTPTVIIVLRNHKCPVQHARGFSVFIAYPLFPESHRYDEGIGVFRQARRVIFFENEAPPPRYLLRKYKLASRRHKLDRKR